MKVSFILGHELPFPPKKGGGVNSLLDGLSQAMASLGHEVTAYSPSIAEREDKEVLNGVRHIRINGAERVDSKLKNFARGIPYIRKIFSRLEPCDVLSCHLLHGFTFANTSKAKIVTHTIHRDPKKFLYLFAGMNRIYTGTDTVTKEAQTVVPQLSSKFKTIYNCVDFSCYETPKSRERDGRINFLYVGRFSRDKGLETIVHAFCEAASLNQSIFFKTVGPLTKDGGAEEDLVEELRKLVLSKGLENRIRFQSPIYDRKLLDIEISKSDVVVLPSTGGETLNMSILECMRLGKPFLISDLPANRPLLLPGQTGNFALSGDIEDWRVQLLEISKDVEVLESWGMNSYNYGKQKFSTTAIANQYIEDFTELINQR